MLWLLNLGITMLFHNKDDVKFVTEFPCSLGHPAGCMYMTILKKIRAIIEFHKKYLLLDFVLLVNQYKLLLKRHVRYKIFFNNQIQLVISN